MLTTAKKIDHKKCFKKAFGFFIQSYLKILQLAEKQIGIKCILQNK